MKQESPLTAESTKLFLQLCDRRGRGEPVQYILGDWDFYDMTVKCRSPVLIPRPETEELVDYILKSKILQSLATGEQTQQQMVRILDVGAGSGVIGIALLHNLPNSECIALDINEVAVELANENARFVLQNSSNRYQCLHTSFMDFLYSREDNSTVTKVKSKVTSLTSTTSEFDQTKNSKDNTMLSSISSQLFDIIISNPPYIPSADVAELQTEVRDWEDPRALDGGLDGLDMIKELIRHAHSLMRPFGTRELWLEVSHLHPEVVRKWTEKEKIPVDLIETWNDLSGKPRFVRLRYAINR